MNLKISLGWSEQSICHLSLFWLLLSHGANILSRSLSSILRRLFRRQTHSLSCLWLSPLSYLDLHYKEALRSTQELDKRQSDSVRRTENITQLKENTWLHTTVINHLLHVKSWSEKAFCMDMPFITVMCRLGHALIGAPIFAKHPEATPTLDFPNWLH